jgi:hypothetical protein
MKCGELYLLYKRAIESNLVAAAARADLNRALESRKHSEVTRLKLVLCEAEIRSKFDLDAVVEHLSQHKCHRGSLPDTAIQTAPVSFVATSNAQEA